MLEVGTTVGRYRVDALIGEGDLASTWRVSTDGASYALRVLVVRDAGFRERLLHTSRAQAHAAHPHLLKVVDVIDVDGTPGVVTEFVEGVDLEHWIAHGPHRPLEVLTLFRQMVDGVRAAHASGLIHRNLKPSKVLIGRAADGGPRVQIADFLLGKVRQDTPTAALTQLGTTFGTPQYMSPEQFRGAATVDERADLFALGCLLYEMATGRRAFDGKNLLDVYNQVAAGEYRPVDEARPGLPPWVGALVAKLLAPEPNDRIPTAADLLREIEKIEAEFATPAPTTRVLPPPTRKRKRESEDDDDYLDELPAPGPPTWLVLLASLLLGLFVGLLIVIPMMIFTAWWLGAFS